MGIGVEAQPQVEDMSAITHQHASGEMVAAPNLEAARKMCPVLGRLSLEEAGLLLELKMMGNEQITDKQNAPPEKSVIQKIENTKPTYEAAQKKAKPEAKEVVDEAPPEAQDLVKQIVEPAPAIEEISDVRASESVEPASHTARIHYVETPPSSVKGTDLEFGETDAVPITILKPIVNQPLISRVEEARRQMDTQFIETIAPQVVQPAAADHAPAFNELTIKPRDESPLELNREAQAFGERYGLGALPIVTNMELPLAAGTISEPLHLEFEDKVISDDGGELVEPVIVMGTGQSIDYIDLDAPYAIPMIEKTDQDYTELNDDEAPRHMIETVSLAEDRPTKFTEAEAEPLPIIEIAELSAPVAQIEATVVRLVEAIENGESEEAEKINVIVEEIIELPAKLEQAAHVREGILEEKLEELFVELFEGANSSYSPELIESFVELTKSHYLEQMLDSTVELEETADLPHEIGTREFLQKLHHGLSAMRQTVSNFYEIGKYFLHLPAN